jgi:hypothetical protein
VPSGRWSRPELCVSGLVNEPWSRGEIEDVVAKLLARQNRRDVSDDSWWVGRKRVHESDDLGRAEWLCHCQGGTAAQILHVTCQLYQAIPSGSRPAWECQTQYWATHSAGNLLGVSARNPFLLRRSSSLEDILS